jgi:divalent metal cation (Fe/Co/Zn/Cd) transporter
VSNGVVTDRTAEDLRRRGLRLEWATNSWNAMEVVVTIALGVQAGSLALVAFGLDSVVEIFASTVVIRNLHDDRRDPGDRRVHRALRLIAAAFWALAVFLGVMSSRGLVLGDHPDSSPAGIAYMVVTAGVMFGLALLKRDTAEALGSEPLHAEAAMTFLDGCLSSSVLVALVLNAWLGWWWADPIAALLVAAAAINEGVDLWRESVPHAPGDEEWPDAAGADPEKRSR